MPAWDELLMDLLLILRQSVTHKLNPSLNVAAAPRSLPRPPFAEHAEGSIDLDG